MKTIYSLHLSEDGIFYEAYTNKKALYNGIMRTNYRPVKLDLFVQGEGISEVTFSYNNLCKHINSIYKIACEGGATISINELNIVSK